jgi:hypothetical protein
MDVIIRKIQARRGSGSPVPCVDCVVSPGARRPLTDADWRRRRASGYPVSRARSRVPLDGDVALHGTVESRAWMQRGENGAVSLALDRVSAGEASSHPPRLSRPDRGR